MPNFRWIIQRAALASGLLVLMTYASLAADGDGVYHLGGAPAAESNEPASLFEPVQQLAQTQVEPSPYPAYSFNSPIYMWRGPEYACTGNNWTDFWRQKTMADNIRYHQKRLCDDYQWRAQHANWPMGCAPWSCWGHSCEECNGRGCKSSLKCMLTGHDECADGGCVQGDCCSFNMASHASGIQLVGHECCASGSGCCETPCCPKPLCGFTTTGCAPAGCTPAGCTPAACGSDSVGVFRTEGAQEQEGVYRLGNFIELCDCIQGDAGCQTYGGGYCQTYGGDHGHCPENCYYCQTYGSHRCPLFGRHQGLFGHHHCPWFGQDDCEECEGCDDPNCPYCNNGLRRICRNIRRCIRLNLGRRWGHYKMVYPVGGAGYGAGSNLYPFDRRDGWTYAAQGYGVPVSVPLAPNVEHTYNYSWGVPASRLTPISRPIYNPTGMSGLSGYPAYPGMMGGMPYGAPLATPVPVADKSDENAQPMDKE